MRPCDDTFGLVRGNRRKAVFAFKGLFLKGARRVFASGQWVLPRISEVRGQSKLAEHTPIFANKTAGRGLAALLCARYAFPVHIVLILFSCYSSFTAEVKH